ncbi:MAG TPA: ribosome biogenesis GTPase Der [Ignavibacteria bacterium]|nr:ribosome biogenesis GTPase Der [Ignavibacteria bacterium]
MENVVAIVGRPNVGKSTLFNRLVGKKTAIVHEQSGVTRDRNYGEVEWTGKKFFLIDTGGYVPHSEEQFEKAIRAQVQLAIDEADEILFVVDAKNGLHPVDKVLADMLRKHTETKKIILVANKIDIVERTSNALEFYSLGLGEPFAMSAINGFNSGDLLDIITADFPLAGEEKEDNVIKFAIIGKPNAGKSSIANALLDEERNIVTDIPGTTRDTIDSNMKYYGDDVLLIDTAGLRKKTKVKESIEFYSTIRAYKAIERCNVAILVIDATLLIEELDKSSDMKLATFKLDKQDVKILEEVVRRRKGLLIVINKWDLVEKDANTAKIVEQKITEHLKSFTYLKFVFISALTKQRIHKVLEEAVSIYKERAKKVKTSELNEALLNDIRATPPQSLRGKEIKISYITQIKGSPPVFIFFVNDPEGINDNYKRFLEKKLREHFGFKGIPIDIAFRKKND